MTYSNSVKNLSAEWRIFVSRLPIIQRAGCPGKDARNKIPMPRDRVPDLLPSKRVWVSRLGNPDQLNHQSSHAFRPKRSPFAVTHSNRTVTISNH